MPTPFSEVVKKGRQSKAVEPPKKEAPLEPYYGTNSGKMYPKGYLYTPFSEILKENKDRNQAYDLLKQHQSEKAKQRELNEMNRRKLYQDLSPTAKHKKHS